MRGVRELSIEDLAADAGLHWTSVSRIENGKQSPTWDSVANLATALDIEIADLARDAERPVTDR